MMFGGIEIHRCFLFNLSHLQTWIFVTFEVQYDSHRGPTEAISTIHFLV